MYSEKEAVLIADHKVEEYYKNCKTTGEIPSRI